MSISLQSPMPDARFAPSAKITVRGTLGPATGLKVTSSAVVPTQFDASTSASDGNGWKYENYTLPAVEGVYYLHVRGRAGNLVAYDKVRVEIKIQPAIVGTTLPEE